TFTPDGFARISGVSMPTRARAVLTLDRVDTPREIEVSGADGRGGTGTLYQQRYTVDERRRTRQIETRWLAPTTTPQPNKTDWVVERRILNSHGQPTSITRTPDGGTWTYDYDSLGGVIAAVDPLANRTTTYFDPDAF